MSGVPLSSTCNLISFTTISFRQVVRRALANAVFDWSSGATFDRWKRGDQGYNTGADVAARVAEWDALQIGLNIKQQRS